MKKIISRIKKIFVIFGTFMISLYSKVMAIEVTESLYGPPKDATHEIMPDILRLIEFIVIPLIFIIGAFVYIKKSSNNVLRIVIAILTFAIIVTLECIGVNYIINNVI